MSLTPIRRLGSSSPYLVAGGDFIGVEAAPTGSTDHTGLNEAARWTIDVRATVDVEHYAETGVHNTIRVPRALIVAFWNGSTYEVTADGSFCQDTSGNVTRGTAAAALSRVADGQIDVTLAHAMPSATYRIKDATFGLNDAGYGINATRVHVLLESLTSSTVFRIKRYEDPDFATLAAADGSFTIAVYDA